MLYDVVIIGSGFGGLACGRLLSQAGLHVVVLERHWQPGGCLQSYKRHGLTFDTGFHYVGGLAEGQKLHAVFSQLGLMALPWHRLDADGFDRITIGSHEYVFAEGYTHFIERLSDDFPHQRVALQQYVDMLRRMADAQGDTLTDGMATNAYDWLTATFSDPLLVDVLAGSCLKTELCRESLPLMAFAHSQDSYIQSSWRLRGDGSLIADTLVEGIRQKGGEVVCKAEVTALEASDGQLSAACCSNGERYEGRWFVSDIHPSLLFPLVGDTPVLRPLFRRRMAQLANTYGMYTLSLVLKPGALPYFNHNKFVYGEGGVWNAPTPKLMVSCRVPDDGGDYAQIVDLLTPCQGDPLPLAETVIPGLRDMVSEQYASSPQTWQRFTGTPGGSAYGVRKDCRYPLLTMLSVQTPLPNLLLTGQNVMLHGLEGVAMTALETTKQIIARC